MSWRCDYCDKKIGRTYVLEMSAVLCSDLCHLRYWKENAPAFGGRWITDEDIARVESLKGDKRKAEYKRIINFNYKNVDSTEFMLMWRYGRPPNL